MGTAVVDEVVTIETPTPGTEVAEKTVDAEKPVDLARLFASSGPFATVYITRPSAERPAEQAAQRWQALRRTLASQGAPNAVLEHLDAALTTWETSALRCLVATADGVLLDEIVMSRTETETVSWSLLPDLVPLLSFAQDRFPFTLVRIDRTGADIEIYHSSSFDQPGEKVVVEGSHDELRKVHAGGWADRRYDERAEDSWDGNAKEVASVLATLVRRHVPRLVLVAGDERAAQKLEVHAPAPVRGLLCRLGGHGRARDGGEAVLRTQVEAAVAAQAAHNVQEVVDHFLQERGQGDLAVDGPAATLRALSMSQVATLLVSKNTCTGQAWYSTAPCAASLKPSVLEDLGAFGPLRAPLRDIAVRCAARTGADIVVVDDGHLLEGGLGAILRFSLNT